MPTSNVQIQSQLTVYETVASGFRPDQATTPVAALAGQDSLPPVLLRAIGTKHPADLTRRDTDITRRHIGVGANVLVKLPHERDAELSDLVVRLALGVEVRSAFATTHGHCELVSRVLVLAPRS